MKPDIDHQNDDVEKLKRRLFDAGREAIERVLGYEIDPEEDKDVTDRRLDMALESATPERLLELRVVAAVDELMLDTMDNLRCEPDDHYDQGYHDALLDVLEILGQPPRPEYGKHFD